MANTIDNPMQFSREWTDPEDFPTYEGSEEQVRADMQSLHTEMQTYVNQTVVPKINEVIGEVNAFEEQTVPDFSIVHAKLASGDDTLEGNTNPSYPVQNDNIADNAVEARNIKNGEVTQDKLGSDIFPEKVKVFAVTALPSELTDDAIYLVYEAGE